MSIVDFRTAPAETEFETDLCIIGAGAAGLTVALEFLDSPIRVCLLESGGFEPDPEIEELSEIENIGMPRAPQHLTRRRGLGGTTALWSGRCGIFDPLDYQRRDWVPYSGWPISSEDVAPYFGRASRILELGPVLYDDDHADYFRNHETSGWSPDLLRPLLWQFSRHGAATEEVINYFAGEVVEGAQQLGMLQHSGAPKPKHLGEAALSSLSKSGNIQLLLHASAISIETHKSPEAVSSVRIRSLERIEATVAARFIVLACGGYRQR